MTSFVNTELNNGLTHHESFLFILKQIRNYCVLLKNIKRNYSTLLEERESNGV